MNTKTTRCGARQVGPRSPVTCLIGYCSWAAVYFHIVWKPVSYYVGSQVGRKVPRVQYLKDQVNHQIGDICHILL